MDVKKRIPYWDNVKLLLIFLVVLGHYFGYGFVYGDTSQGRWLLPNGIYGFVYTFHMPLFAFVSGFFSRNTKKCRKRAIGEYFLPYLVFNTLCILLNRLLLQVPMENPLLHPYNHMWYLFALFFWRWTADTMKRIPHSPLVTGGMALVLSFTPVMEMELLSRLFLFWPFFLLGLQMEEAQVLRVKNLPHWLCGVLLAGGLLLSVGILWKFHCSTYRLCFIGRRLGLNRAGVMELCKLILRYGTAVLFGICVLNLVPRRELRVTGWGKNTMSVYLLHALPKLRNTINAINPFWGYEGLCLGYYTLWTVLAVVLFGHPRVARWIGYILKWMEKIYGYVFTSNA